ncbi:hypothetical protein [Yinghuangia aomiensis]|uniref:hypothetical protein n=1 Tax=Yinghuangia aomiensis TaxID=676205 RepID=UPI0031E5C5C3
MLGNSARRAYPTGATGVAPDVWEIQQPLTYDADVPPPPPRGFLAARWLALRLALDAVLPGGPRYGRVRAPRPRGAKAAGDASATAAPRPDARVVPAPRSPRDPRESGDGPARRNRLAVRD